MAEPNYMNKAAFSLILLSWKYFHYHSNTAQKLKALNDPSSIVISQEMALRYFGNANPVGQQMLLNKTPVFVRGVFQKNPKFHLPFDFLRPIASARDYIPAERMQSWSWQQFYHLREIETRSRSKSPPGKISENIPGKSNSIAESKRPETSCLFSTPQKHSFTFSRL